MYSRLCVVLLRLFLALDVNNYIKCLILKYKSFIFMMVQN